MGGLDGRFICGVIYGGIAVGVLGIILNNIRASRAQYNAQYRPLDAFPDAAQPGLNAARIVSGSWRGFFGCLFWSVIFLIVLAAFYKGLSLVYHFALNFFGI
jgi:hypothetical protein